MLTTKVVGRCTGQNRQATGLSRGLQTSRSSVFFCSDLPSGISHHPPHTCKLLASNCLLASLTRPSFVDAMASKGSGTKHSGNHESARLLPDANAGRVRALRIAAPMEAMAHCFVRGLQFDRRSRSGSAVAFLRRQSHSGSGLASETPRPQRYEK